MIRQKLICELQMSASLRKEIHDATATYEDMMKSGQINFTFKENWRESIETKYDPNKHLDSYIMASFGSAWATVKV